MAGTKNEMQNGATALTKAAAPARRVKRKPSPVPFINPYGLSDTAPSPKKAKIQITIAKPAPSAPPASNSQKNNSAPSTTSPANNGAAAPSKPSRLMSTGIGFGISGGLLTAGGIVTILVLTSIPVVGWALLAAGCLSLLVGASLMLAARFSKPKQAKALAQTQAPQSTTISDEPSETNKPTPSPKKQVQFRKPLESVLNTVNKDQNIPVIETAGIIKPTGQDQQKTTKATKVHKRAKTVSDSLTYLPNTTTKPKQTDENTQARLNSLEDEVSRLQAENGRLLQAAVQNASSNSNNNAVVDNPVSDGPAAPPPPPPPLDPNFNPHAKRDTWAEIKGGIDSKMTPEELKKRKEKAALEAAKNAASNLANAAADMANKKKKLSPAEIQQQLDDQKLKNKQADEEKNNGINPFAMFGKKKPANQAPVAQTGSWELAEAKDNQSKQPTVQFFNAPIVTVTSTPVTPANKTNSPLVVGKPS